MPLDEKNLEITLRLIAAHQGRYAEIQEIGGRLLNPVVYRSRDGALAVGQLSQAEKDQLTAKLTELLDEAGVIAANVRQALTPEGRSS